MKRASHFGFKAFALGLAAWLSACQTAPRSEQPVRSLPAVQTEEGPAVLVDYGRVMAIDPLRTQTSYRVLVQLENGVLRAYEVQAPGDLRVGDRVRIENSQIFRM